MSSTSSGQAGEQPLTPQRKLELVGARLNELFGDWALADGPILRGPGPSAVRLAPSHHDDPRHLDLEFVLDLDDPVRTTITDCCAGIAEGIEEAVTQGIGVWSDTTAATLLELMTQRGKFADSYGGRAPGGFPGWHAIVGGVAAWGIGSGPAAAQRWMVDTRPWAALAPVLKSTLYPKRFNGIKLFIGGNAENSTAEVRVNGSVHTQASRAMFDLGWPPLEESGFARTFVLLVHPDS